MLDSESKKTVIECDCGTHLLQVQSEVDYYEDSDKTRFRQEYYLAMFYYGIESSKTNWWNRVVIACKYLWTGKMFSDQLCLSPEEALKLSSFINETLIKEE
jgi:hypothetical protein